MRRLWNWKGGIGATSKAQCNLRLTRMGGRRCGRAKLRRTVPSGCPTQRDRPGSLVVCGAVYAELIAYPGTSVAFAGGFLRTTDIAVEVDLDRELWQDAERRFA